MSAYFQPRGGPLQVSGALASAEAFDRWGEHFLRFSPDASLHQRRNNFKDPGGLTWGGPPFNAQLAKLNDAFLTLGVPQPSLRPPTIGAARNGWLEPAPSLALPTARERTGVALRGNAVSSPSGVCACAPPQLSALSLSRKASARRHACYRTPPTTQSTPPTTQSTSPTTQSTPDSSLCRVRPSRAWLARHSAGVPAPGTAGPYGGAAATGTPVYAATVAAFTNAYNNASVRTAPLRPAP